MNRKHYILGLISLLFILSGCKTDYTRYEGNYIFEKKIDEADKSETVYTKGSNRYNMGYTISATENGLSVQPVKMQEDGHLAPAKRSQNLDLEQTDDGVFQYKKKDGSLVLTFAFSDQELLIMEFTKDGSGNFQKESTLILKKL